MSEQIKRQKRLYSMKEASQMCDLSEHTIRNYLKDFNIITEETPGGHRRFNNESITLLKKAKALKEEQNLSISQIRSFFHGEVSEHLLNNEPNLKSNLEKEVEKLSEQVQNLTQVVELFPEMLKHSLELQSKQLVEQFEKRENQILLDFKEQQKEEPKKSFFSRFFS